MRKSILGGAAALVLSTVAATAADILPPAPPPPPAPPAPVFTWEGPYRGGYVGYTTFFPGFVTGSQFGYNFRIGQTFIAGIEIETEGYFLVPLVDASLNARFGATVGSSDRVLLYSQVGIGTSIGAAIWSAGGGVEIAFRERFSFFAEAKANFVPGFGYDATEIRAGINLHPGDANTPNPDGTFGWGGLYMGTLAEGTFGGGAGFGDAGVQVGYNFQRGAFVGGFEAQTTHGFGFGPLIMAQASARAGVALGAADRVLAYGEVGVGTLIVLPIWTAGGGVEFAVGERFSVFTEAEAVFLPGIGFLGTQVSGGLNIHFGGR
ncbi:MAG: hypothetical protein KIS96_06790 [Bauldia sp.]|nr:hypothetical protein [Bauldia sp.]